jgi:hypothetical protein
MIVLTKWHVTKKIVVVHVHLVKKTQIIIFSKIYFCYIGSYNDEQGGRCKSCPSGTVSSFGSRSCSDSCPPGKIIYKKQLLNLSLDTNKGLVLMVLFFNRKMLFLQILVL